MIRVLDSGGLVDLNISGRPVYAVKMTRTGEKALRELKRKAGSLKQESREETPVSE